PRTTLVTHRSRDSGNRCRVLVHAGFLAVEQDHQQISSRRSGESDSRPASQSWLRWQSTNTGSAASCRYSDALQSRRWNPALEDDVLCRSKQIRVQWWKLLLRFLCGTNAICKLHRRGNLLHGRPSSYSKFQNEVRRLVDRHGSLWQLCQYHRSTEP